MRVFTHPVVASRPYSAARRWSKKRFALVPCLASAYLVVLALPGIGGNPAGGVSPRVMVRAHPRSWLGQGTLLTAYGRGFGVAPILGQLGRARNLDDVAAELEPARREIAGNSGGRTVRLAIHLIYALATPCTQSPSCLLYLDGQGVDITKQYIEPALRRGWLVILDDQLGRSNPAAEVRRMIQRGYLAYDNVEVAFDPEFRSARNQAYPGVPVGYVTAGELNRAGRKINAYSRRHNLLHTKLMLVHQWAAGMIRGRDSLRTNLPYIQPVVVMDGIGTPGDKAGAYRSIFGPGSQGLVAGIKLFPPNKYDSSGRWDTPMLSWRALFGREPV